MQLSSPQAPRAATGSALALVITMIGGAAPARAQEVSIERGVDATLRVYTDNDRVTVVTPSAFARGRIAGPVSAEVGATVDVVSAASIDVTSQASPRAFEERRYEGAAAVTWAATPHLSVTGRFVGSVENDYRSLVPGVGLRLDLNRHTTFIDLGYTAIFDVVGRAGDPDFARDRRGHRVVLTLTQLLTPTTALDLTVDGGIDTGYQASPYRYVPILGPGGQRLYSLGESVPDQRLRGAALLRLRHAAFRPGRLFLHADYRLYLDGWGITSHTATARVLAPIADRRVTLALEVRGGYQTAASFYRSNYVDDGRGAPALRTRERTLGGVGSFGASLVADVALGRDPRARGLRAVASLSWLRFHWLDFPLQDRRDALVAGVALTAPF